MVLRDSVVLFQLPMMAHLKGIVRQGQACVLHNLICGAVTWLWHIVIPVPVPIDETTAEQL